MSPALRKIKLPVSVFAVTLLISGCGSSFLAEADALYKSGDYKAAVNAYREAAKSHPRSAQAYYMLGLSLAELKKMSESYEAFEKAVEIKPSHSGAASRLIKIYISQGDLLLNKKDYAGAVSKYKKAVSLNDSEPTALFKLAEGYAAAGLLKAAGKYYNLAVKNGGDRAQADEGAERIEKLKSDSADMFEKGKTAYEKGHLSTAKKHLDKAVAMNRDDPQNIYLSSMCNGRILFRKGGKNDLWDALIEFGKAAEVNKSAADPHYFQALAYFKKDKNDFDTFIAEFGKALELEPKGVYSSKIRKELAKQKKRKKTLDEFWGR